LIEGSRREGTQIFQSGIFTTTVENAQGRGGNVRIATDSIRLANGAAISTATANDFRGGTVTLNANIFEAIDGRQVSTSTSSGGQAGNIRLTARDRITLSESNPFDIGGNQGRAWLVCQYHVEF
jgi:large exoprotein involved in heme utilization and adhesion